MSVRNGRQLLAMPGPTTVPDEVLAAMHRPSVDIYGGELVDVTTSCLEDLRTIFATRGRTYIYIANGHGAWEAALSNVLSAGDKVLVLESGRFAIGWGEMASMMGIEVEVLDGRPRRGFDPAALEARLRADTRGEIKAVLVVQIDTASSVVNDIQALRKAIDAAGHDALFMVDAVASLGTMPFEMDAWGIDVAVTGAQKGLMTPPGLAFVAAQGKAMDAHARAGLRTRYWDWTAREGEAHYMKYCGTPPVQMLFALRQALDMLMAEGLEHVFARHATLAATTRAAVERWSEGQVLSFNIVEPTERANSVTTVRVEGDGAGRLLKWCEAECGVVLGIGIGDIAGKGFRIAHMGHTNAPMVIGTLAAIETALIALDLPHGSGGIQSAAACLGAALKV